MACGESFPDGRGGGLNPVKKHALRGQESRPWEVQNAHELRGYAVESKLAQGMTANCGTGVPFLGGEMLRSPQAG